MGTESRPCSAASMIGKISNFLTSVVQVTIPAVLPTQSRLSSSSFRSVGSLPRELKLSFPQQGIPLFWPMMLLNEELHKEEDQLTGYASGVGK